MFLGVAFGVYSVWVIQFDIDSKRRIVSHCQMMDLMHLQVQENVMLYSFGIYELLKVDSKNFMLALFPDFCISTQLGTFKGRSHAH